MTQPGRPEPETQPGRPEPETRPGRPEPETRLDRPEPVTQPDRPEPELTEPDLPRTAKVRPKALRTGWTTGTCASAAAKAATTALRDQEPQRTVDIALPSGRRVSFAVESCTYDPARATAVVVKDAGDDPDVTHGAHLTATRSAEHTLNSSHMSISYAV